MTDHADRPAGASSSDVQFLTEALRGVAAAFDQACLSGLSVSVPESLYVACLGIIDRHDSPDGTPGGAPPGARHQGQDRAPARELPGASGHSHGRVAGQVEIQDVPLRRLVWQVIDPGQEFTVADIAARLAELGASYPATAVSNVLGYWASQDRLARVRKGTYLYPRPGSPPGSLNSPNNGQQEGPAASTSRAPKARGEEHGDVPITYTRREAAS